MKKYANMNDEMPITYYRMGSERFPVREPRTKAHAHVSPGEAFLVLDTNQMPMEFQRAFFKFIQTGVIKVQVAEKAHD
jgi:hypothetical protein